MWQSSFDGSSILYLVSTPIGNLDDITYRAVKVLNEVEVIFSEDTRVTSNLLNHLGIRKKLISLHDHNEELVKSKVLDYLKDGFSVALVTDRGTPIVSDPGYKTVKYVSDMGYNVVAIPGVCAFLPALIVSGIEPQPFTFYGFLNSKDSKKRRELEDLKVVRNTLIFYEAPHRIKKTMEMMLDIFGNRFVSLSREISKKFESVYRGDIVSLISSLDDVKGEFVIVVSGNKEGYDNNFISLVDNINFYIDNGMSSMDAIKKVSRERGISKSEVYAAYHKDVRK